jgi:hypothetical protein
MKEKEERGGKKRGGITMNALPPGRRRRILIEKPGTPASIRTRAPSASLPSVSAPSAPAHHATTPP